MYSKDQITKTLSFIQNYANKTNQQAKFKQTINLLKKELEK